MAAYCVYIAGCSEYVYDGNYWCTISKNCVI